MSSHPLVKAEICDVKTGDMLLLFPPTPPFHQLLFCCLLLTSGIHSSFAQALTSLRFPPVTFTLSKPYCLFRCCRFGYTSIINLDSLSLSPEPPTALYLKYGFTFIVMEGLEESQIILSWLGDCSICFPDVDYMTVLSSVIAFE